MLQHLKKTDENEPIILHESRLRCLINDSSEVYSFADDLIFYQYFVVR